MGVRWKTKEEKETKRNNEKETKVQKDKTKTDFEKRHRERNKVQEVGLVCRCLWSRPKRLHFSHSLSAIGAKLETVLERTPGADPSTAMFERSTF